MDLKQMYKDYINEVGEENDAYGSFKRFKSEMVRDLADYWNWEEQELDDQNVCIGE